MENVRVPVKVFGDIVVAGLNKNLFSWELERNLLIIRLETNSRKNLGTRNKNSREKVTKPWTPVSDVIRVALRHGIRPVWDLLQVLLEHDENLLTLRGLHRFIIHFIKNFNHRWIHNKAHLSKIFLFSFYKHTQIVHLWLIGFLKWCFPTHHSSCTD